MDVGVVLMLAESKELGRAPRYEAIRALAMQVAPDVPHGAQQPHDAVAIGGGAADVSAIDG